MFNWASLRSLPVRCAINSSHGSAPHCWSFVTTFLFRKRIDITLLYVNCVWCAVKSKQTVLLSAVCAVVWTWNDFHCFTFKSLNHKRVPSIVSSFVKYFVFEILLFSIHVLNILQRWVIKRALSYRHSICKYTKIVNDGKYKYVCMFKNTISAILLC